MRPLCGLLLGFAVTSCKGPGDTDPPADTDTDLPAPVPQGFVTGEFCLVRTIFEVTCVTGCHSGTVAGGGLDLQTDPWTSLVNRPSQAAPGQVLLQPGSAIDSVLYRKMTGLIAVGEGDVMPPAGLLPTDITDIAKAWIDAGAVNDCAVSAVPGGEPPPPPPPPPPPDPDAETYHPPGYAAADVHGLAMNLQYDGDCRSCHGDQLQGGLQEGAVGCDGCHQGPAWRTDCSYCHGGPTTSAPPEDIDNTSDPALISFVSHEKHVLGAGYGCSQCHYDPEDVLTNGHIFGDVTPGYGEVYNAGGLAVASTYAGGTCSNNYCHGDGQGDNGTVTDGEGPLGCSDCHVGPGSAYGDYARMAGEHEVHMNVVNMTCSLCHSGTVDDAGALVPGAALHVNGTGDYVDSEGVPMLGGVSCSGNCHGFDHQGSAWSL